MSEPRLETRHGAGVGQRSQLALAVPCDPLHDQITAALQLCSLQLSFFWALTVYSLLTLRFIVKSTSLACLLALSGV